jgi:hypothetical protein
MFAFAMYPHTHFLLPFFTGSIFMKFNLWSWEWALLAGIAGVAVDLDHYIEHMLYAKSNKFSLKATWNNSIKFHTFNQRSFIHYFPGAVVVTVVLLALLLISWQLSLALVLGYYTHLLLDLPHIFSKGKSVRFKAFSLYFKRSSTEMWLDGMLIVGILLVFVL